MKTIFTMDSGLRKTHQLLFNLDFTHEKSQEDFPLQVGLE